MLYFKIVYLFLCLSIFNAYAKTDMVVVISKDSTIQTLSPKYISKIFLSKTKEFPNGQKALVADLNLKEYREIFYKKICTKSIKQLKKYWTTLIFTGRGIPPKKINSTDEIIMFINNNKNAISYLPKNLVNSNMKVVHEF